MVDKTHLYLIPLLSTVAGLAYLRWKYAKSPALGSPKIPMLGTLAVGSLATLFMLHKYHVGFHSVLRDMHLESGRQHQLQTNSLVVAPGDSSLEGTIG